MRLWLALAALAVCAAGIGLTVVRSGPAWLIVVLALLAVSALADLRVIVRRKRRGEAG